jgi:thymidylate synthase (FAD)
MNIVIEPKITVVGQSEFIPHPEYDIPPEEDHALALTAFSAKTCYNSFGIDGRSCEDNQRAIMEHKHGSVLEHYHVSMMIEGITRGLSLELNRHRSFNISQRSTRYTAEEDAAFVLEPYFAMLYEKYRPHFIKGTGWVITNPDSHDEWTDSNRLMGHYLLLGHLNSLSRSQKDYEYQVELLEKLNPNELSGFDLRKWARGKARNVLPHALETKGTWTNNLRGWRWFIESRSSRHAEPEIRVLANGVLDALRVVSPVHFEDFKANGTHDNIIEWVPEHSKV